MEIFKKSWGKTKKNEEVFLYTLKNEFLEVEVLNYGGIIKSILASDKNGKKENVVLSLPTIEDYEKRSPYFGAIVGRNAGRIKDGILKIDGVEYALEKNSGNNSLHGGIDNFSHKIWKVEKEIQGDKGILILTLKSPHLEEGFPGNVEITVKYTLYKNELWLDYKGTSDRKTYLNLTNHSYFNLSGNFANNVKNQYLTLNSKEFIAVDEQTLPVEIRKVDNTPFDFRNSKLLEEVFNSSYDQVSIVNNGIDHPFILDKKKNHQIILEDRSNGRVLEIETDQPAVVIYSGNYLHEVGDLEHKVKCEKYMGICFETQNYADAINFLPDKAVLTSPEKEYTQETKYIFKINK